MRIDQILDMDIIANGSAVWGGIVRSVDFHGRSPSRDCQERVRDEMSFRSVIFTMYMGRPGDIEVPEGNPA